MHRLPCLQIPSISSFTQKRTFAQYTRTHYTHISFLLSSRIRWKYIRKGKSGEDFLRLFMKIKKKVAVLGREEKGKKPEASPVMIKKSRARLQPHD